jgi:hypothetical protein
MVMFWNQGENVAGKEAISLYSKYLKTFIDAVGKSEIISLQAIGKSSFWSPSTSERERCEEDIIQRRIEEATR